MSWERLGVEVRRRRKQLNMSQPAMAERGGLSVSTIRNIENNRAGRLSRRMRQALERAVEWEPGSVDAVLAGGAATPVRKPTVPVPTTRPDQQTPAATAERFAIARALLKVRRLVIQHHDEMPGHEALDADLASAARETEEALIWMLPWLADDERAEAIHILAELRDG